MTARFYSTKRLLLDNAEALLFGEHVFIGNQTDDFAAAGVLAPGSRVLLLGLGYGAVVRPIASWFGDDLSLHVVESNPRILNICENIFAEYLGGLPGVSFQRDAQEYVANSTESYDAICIDIYTDEGYPPFMFQTEFWTNVRRILAPNGVVLVNAFGIPQHLRPLEGRTPQRALVALLESQWGEVRSLPCRRNMTLVCGGSQQASRERRPSPALRGVDAVMAGLYASRLANAEIVTAAQLESSDSVLKSSPELMAEMEARWSTLVEMLSRASQACGLGVLTRTDLRPLLRDGTRAGPITEHLLAEGRPEASFVPIAVAAQVFEGGSPGLEWYPHWVVERADALCARSREWFVNTALWQALTMLACPYSQLDDQLPKIVATIERLRL